MNRNIVPADPRITYEMTLTVWRDGHKVDTVALTDMVPSRSKADEMALRIAKASPSKR